MFITIEGPDGSGKGTVIEGIKKNYPNIIFTREPGGVAISEAIREIILDNKNTEMDKMTEAFLYAAARRQHLIEKIIPALNEGKVVLCDRFIDSSLVYQGYARGIGMEEILALNKFAIGEVIPQLTIYLDIAPEKGLYRVQMNRKNKQDRLDNENLSFHKKVHEGYTKLALQEKRIYTINADQSKEAVLKDVLLLLREVL